MQLLWQYLSASAKRRPDHTAIEDPGRGEITYAALDALTDRIRDRLRALGVTPGDRVGLCLRKSIDSVAVIFGAQKCGAVHVPVDSTGPGERIAYIFRDCAVRVAVVERERAEELRALLPEQTALLVLDLSDADPSADLPIVRALDLAGAAPSTGASHPSNPDDLAYILYTSGSTGLPKGVMLTQRNACVFVDWCSDTFAPRDDDRFSSHAPFHFDLSVLDIYLPLKHGATLVLISEQVGKDPVGMAALIAERRLTCWYSAPSILSLLCQFGHLERRDYSSLRLILFAGEVFPVRYLRELMGLIPAPRYWNLYGPTETNVCTAYEIPKSFPEDRTDPFPIGQACAHYAARVVDTDGRNVPRGSEGELWIGGSGVMQGYWNLPERNADVFRVDEGGATWYRTGDVVIDPGDGEFIFRGRRDRMVKKRGYRIELGEIESGLIRHPSVREAAVIATTDADGGVRIRAFLGAGEEKLSIIKLKQFCAEHLLAYMIPDEFTVLPTLPKTSTDKTDYQALKAIP
ncbi:MAG: amino acid adenylation domain-containing protein [Candidatus Eisenbacteria bacterium]|nr:amino acid adenylation domain-containing protein [Candidatus Eisenbacteria bacterium]